MRNPEHKVRIDDWRGATLETESMRQTLNRAFGPMWQLKSPAEMLFEMSAWCDEDGDCNGDIVAVGRRTIVALATYAGIREENFDE